MIARKIVEVIEVSFEIDTMLKLKKYDIYNNADIGDKEIKKIEEVISADKSIDLQ